MALTLALARTLTLTLTLTRTRTLPLTKVGTCTVAPDAAWPKRVSHLLKDRQTTTRSLGLRIIGVHQPAANPNPDPNPSLTLTPA